MSKFSKFKDSALSRDQMREVSGGQICDPTPINYGKGPYTGGDGSCYNVYNCRPSFLGIPYGKKQAKWVKIPGCKSNVRY